MEETWKVYDLVVNGLNQNVRFREETVRTLFLPFLNRLAELQRAKQHRLIVFLAAPPATGKSTLVLFLEQLARNSEGMPVLQAIGLDGFHFHAEEIAGKTVCRDGETIPMREVKGCAESFNAEKLCSKLKSLCGQEEISWPVYDRRMHDVVEDVLKVNGDIILLEGNWLLLQEPRWQAVRQYADYTVLLRAEAAQLKERLIQRKIQGGKTAAEAAAFYLHSDRFNVERVLQDSGTADEEWQLMENGDYRRIQGNAD